MISTIAKPTSSRKQQIAAAYLQLLDQHIQDLKAGKVDRIAEIRDFAEELNIHPRHLSNTLSEVLEQSPCSLYEERLLRISKELILESQSSIAEIARHLHYDPSNFSKFFKEYTGMTPNQFRITSLDKGKAF